MELLWGVSGGLVPKRNCFLARPRYTVLAPRADDFFFRSYVDPPNPVPEPSTLLLVGTGAIGLIHRLRRRP